MKYQTITCGKTKDYLPTIETSFETQWEYTGFKVKNYFIFKCKCGSFRKLRPGEFRAFGLPYQCDDCRQGDLARSHNSPRLHRIWSGMKTRCTDANSTNFKNYGGRGITVTPEWMRSFRTFVEWALAHGYKDGLSIERIDNNGSYGPSNCRWATAEEQGNNKRNNRIIEFDGQQLTISQWAEKLGMSRDVLANRIYNGRSIEDSLTLPVEDGQLNKIIIFQGKSQTVSEWANSLGIRPYLLLQRLNREMPLEKAMTSQKWKKVGK